MFNVKGKPMKLVSFISRALLGLAFVHIGTVGNAAILIAAYVCNNYTSGFFERIYHMGLMPGFILLCFITLAGLIVLVSTPDKQKEGRTE